MKTIAYDNPPIGCYFDGCHGQAYNDRRVLELALSYGWQDEDGKRLAEVESDPLTDNPEFTDEDDDILYDTVEDAIEYLNGLEHRSFLSWQWYEGDFGLYPYVEGAQEDCEFVSSKSQEYPPDDYEGEWLHVNDHGNATLYMRTAGQDKEIWSCV